MKKGFNLLIVLAALAFLACSPGEGELKARTLEQEWLETLKVGEPFYYENLTIVPVYAGKVRDATSYTTLEEALKEKGLQIEELEGGRVPEVKLTNLSAKPIYLMGGEILAGCKQDRIVGRDVLIGPYARDVRVPVYCVEQGRWHPVSTSFYSKQNLGTQRMRAEAQKGSGEAQARIWGKVREQNMRLNVTSGTGAYQDAYENKEVKEKIAGYEQRMQNVPQLEKDAVGVIVAVGNTIQSVDIFANPQTFKKLWPKILRSSALSAASENAQGTVTQKQAAAFLCSFYNGQFGRKPAVDLGYDLSVADGGANVVMLVYRDVVIHCAAFPQTADEKASGVSGHQEQRINVIPR